MEMGEAFPSHFLPMIDAEDESSDETETEDTSDTGVTE